MSNWSKLAPYWFLLFTIGFGWFVLSPLVPILGKFLGVGISAVILLLSIYGYTMVVLGLLAGYISAKFTVKAALYSSAIISVIGLIGRALSPNYLAFIITGTIAAIAYPLAMAPVGSVASSIFKDKSHTVIGISVGMLFLGMAFGAFLGPGIYAAVGLSGTLWTTVVLAIIAAIWIFFGINGYPTFYKGRSLKGSFKLGMIKNWYVGLSISAISVMFGGIASTVLGVHNVAGAIAYGGLMGGLAFLGSALGAIILPPIFEQYKKFRLGLVSTGVLMFLAALLMVLGLAYTSAIAAIALGFFLFGFFGNAYWSMAMTSTTNYVSDPAQAGFATSMYSVFTNLGVAFIPVALSGYFASLSTIAIGVTVVLAIEFVAMLVAPTLLAQRAAERGSSARARGAARRKRRTKR
ncbi:MFS transporter [Candidatus Marsarchaeota archaeon]|nr:MFS transporter [Candidatus Marsarchaeota archaeon]